MDMRFLLRWSRRMSAPAWMRSPRGRTVMRHDQLVGQASDQASDSVGQAGAGDHDDKSKAKARRSRQRPVCLSGQSRSPAPTWQRTRRDRGRQAESRTAIKQRPNQTTTAATKPRRSRTAPLAMSGEGQPHRSSAPHRWRSWLEPPAASLTVGLAGAGWSEEDDVLAGRDEVEGAQVGDGVALERSGVIEV